MEIDRAECLAALRAGFESFAAVSEASWQLLASIAQFQRLQRGQVLVQEGQPAKYFHFICKGAIRAYYSDAQGNTYNKNLFLERQFPASTVSLLLGTPSKFTLEALENSLIINLPYQEYRKLLMEHNDLKNFYIAYLERNWIIEKEQREISIVMETAAIRYQKLLEAYPGIDKRIPQLHIASHLGITPTQLSRIRKDLKKATGATAPNKHYKGPEAF